MTTRVQWSGKWIGTKMIHFFLESIWNNSLRFHHWSKIWCRVLCASSWNFLLKIFSHQRSTFMNWSFFRTHVEVQCGCQKVKRTKILSTKFTIIILSFCHTHVEVFLTSLSIVIWKLAKLSKMIHALDPKEHSLLPFQCTICEKFF